MACDTTPFQRGQTLQERKEQVLASVTRLNALLARGLVKPVIGPQGAVTIGYMPAGTHYFDFHHSSLDRIDAVNIDELNGGAGAMATLTWLIAEKGLPSAPPAKSPKPRKAARPSPQ